MVMIMVIHVFMSSWVTKTKVVLATDAMTARFVKLTLNFLGRCFPPFPRPLKKILT